MAQVDLVRSHVERILQDYWDVCRVHVDEDGDIPFRHGTAAVWVRVVDDNPVSVRVWAKAVADVARSARLLAELNDVNSRIRFGRVLWAERAVWVADELSESAVDRSSLPHLCRTVGSVAEDLATLAAVFGGHTPFPADADSPEEVACVRRPWRCQSSWRRPSRSARSGCSARWRRSPTCRPWTGGCASHRGTTGASAAAAAGC